MNKQICAVTVAVFFILCLPFLALAQEQISITTYYPSPYGSYNSLYVANYLGVGTLSPEARLHVVGTGVYYANGQTNALTWGDSSQIAALRYSGSDPMITAISGSLRLTVDNGTNTGMMIQAVTGNVGIGTVSPGAYKCYINGNANVQGNMYVNGGLVHSSDKRLKENINYIESGLDIIERLKPVRFDYINGDKKEAGFIAQEVEAVLPDIVIERPDGMLGLKTLSLISYLVKAAQEQQAEIETLRSEINDLRSRLN